MKILSFGEVLWDVFPDYKTLGGAPFNFSAHTALQGADAFILSATGNDELLKETVEAIKKHNVRTDYLSVSDDKETGKCLVTLDENKIPSYNLLNDVAYDYIKKPVIPEKAFDVFAFGTLALRSQNNLETVKQLILENISREIYSDLNIRAPFYNEESIKLCLENATIVKISDEELPIINKIIFDCQNDLEVSAVKLSENFSQIKIIILTKGEKGSLAYDCISKTFFYADAVPAKLVSTVGAGDSFGATFLCCYLQDKNIKKALEIASRISAFVVSSKDAIPPEMTDFINSLR